jgi:hypothetical protein
MTQEAVMTEPAQRMPALEEGLRRPDRSVVTLQA